MTRKIGIFAGTFDPVHAGHLAFARAAIQACVLDEVVLIPEETPRGKQTVTDIVHRMALLEIATSSDPWLRVMRLRSKRFTIHDTLPELQSISPGDELTFLIGSDVAHYLHSWDELASLLHEATLAIGLRGSDTAQEIHTTMQQLGPAHNTAVQYRLIDTPYADATSSRIRSDIKQAALDPAVTAYIQQHNLYLHRSNDTGTTI